MGRWGALVWRRWTLRDLLPVDVRRRQDLDGTRSHSGIYSRPWGPLDLYETATDALAISVLARSREPTPKCRSALYLVWMEDLVRPPSSGRARVLNHGWRSARAIAYAVCSCDDLWFGKSMCGIVDCCARRPLTLTPWPSPTYRTPSPNPQLRPIQRSGPAYGCSAKTDEDAEIAGFAASPWLRLAPRCSPCLSRHSCVAVAEGMAPAPRRVRL